MCLYVYMSLGYVRATGILCVVLHPASKQANQSKQHTYLNEVHTNTRERQNAFFLTCFLACLLVVLFCHQRFEKGGKPLSPKSGGGDCV